MATLPAMILMGLSARPQLQGWVCMRGAHTSSQGSIEMTSVSQGIDRNLLLLCLEAFKRSPGELLCPSWAHGMVVVKYFLTVWRLPDLGHVSSSLPVSH